MNEILTNALIASLLSAGWTTIFWDGMIFDGIAIWAKQVIPWAYKPLFGCIVCNSFYTGLIFVGDGGWALITPIVSIGISSVILRLTSNFRIQ